MSYEVLTLKYRPKTFGDLVGQATVGETLRRAVTGDRVANAYLFCGSRGVGKTSTARILAKALNCPDQVDGDPCNVCEVCRSISIGEDIDVIEIDGASNRGIDDVRSIRDNAGYVPSRSRYKIYIIDEVHMLTVPAFNALLKVLEEPPSHVKFLFATTDPNQLPDTILSRCQRHEFRRVSVDDIVQRLRDIAVKEGIEVKDDVLEVLAQRSEGGLRDSVSALDQAVSFAGTTIGIEDLERAVGLLPHERSERIFRAMYEGQAATLLEDLESAYWSGFDPKDLLMTLTGSARELMLHLAAPERSTESPSRALFDALAPVVSLDRAMYGLKLLLNAAADMRRGGQERLQLELACLKVARSGELLPVEDLLARVEGKVDPPPLAAAPTPAPRPIEPPVAPIAPAAAPSMAAPPVVEEPPSPMARAPQPASEPAPAPVTAPAPPPMAKKTVPHIEAIESRWNEVSDAMKSHSGALASALAGAKPVAVEGRRVVLEVPAGQSFVMDRLTDSKFEAAFSQATQAVFGLEMGASVRAGAALAAKKERRDAREHPSVRKLMQNFDGGISNVEYDDV